ncbi:MAG: DM13 domain-containing protein [Pseudomonadota bacterium]
MTRRTNTVKAAMAAVAIFLSGGGVASIALTGAAAATEVVDETIIAQGAWTKKFANARGEWSIVERGGSRFVVLSDDFRTRSAPDLKIFLTPTSVAALTGDNATSGSVLIAPLADNRGGQEFEIPADVDLSDYASIAIHCEAYSKLWSAAAL